MTKSLCLPGIALLSLLLFLNKETVAQENPLPKEEKGVLVFGGRVRHYLLHLPPGEIKAPLPLVVALHGLDMSAGEMESLTGLSDLADKEGFAVLYPEGEGLHQDNGQSWNGGACCGYALDHGIDDVGFVEALLKKIAGEIPLDASRIYATGFSTGAFLTYRLGAELSHIFAAIAPVAGSIGGIHSPQSLPFVIPRPDLPVAVVAFHGTDDLSIPYDGGPSHGGYSGAMESSYISPMDSAAFFSTRNRCAKTEEERMSPHVRLEKSTFCEEDADVWLYTLEGGWHAWPGAPGIEQGPPENEISASQAIWAFFRAHPKRIFLEENP